MHVIKYTKKDSTTIQQSAPFVVASPQDGAERGDSSPIQEQADLVREQTAALVRLETFIKERKIAGRPTVE